jgi:hypothetical protein
MGKTGSRTVIQEAHQSPVTMGNGTVEQRTSVPYRRPILSSTSLTGLDQVSSPRPLPPLSLKPQHVDMAKAFPEPTHFNFEGGSGIFL